MLARTRSTATCLREETMSNPSRGLAQGLHVVGFLLIGAVAVAGVEILGQFFVTALGPELTVIQHPRLSAAVASSTVGEVLGAAMALGPVAVILARKPEVITDVWL